MSKKTLEDILICRLKPVEIDGRIYPGLICNAERTEIHRDYVLTHQVKIAHCPAEYLALLYNFREVPYLSALEISAKSKNKMNALEIAIYEIENGLEVKRSEIIKEKDGQTVERKMIEPKEEDLRSIHYISKNLMENIYGYLLNCVDFGRIVSCLFETNDAIRKILLNYVAPNFDRPLNRIGKYPTFYGRVMFIASNPEVLRQIDFHRGI